jgi:phospholipase C
MRQKSYLLETAKRLSTVGLTVALATVGCSHSLMGSAGAGVPSVRRGVPPSRNGASAAIQHVIIMIQENRSFDNFFATFPGADGATQGLMRTKSGRDVSIRLKQASLDSLSLGHQHFTFEHEFAGGRMDGFNQVSLTLSHGVKVPAGKYAYRYVKPKEIQEYWNIAKQYVLADRMFSTQSSSSFTGHQDLIAGGTPVGGGRNVIDFPRPSSWGCDAAPGTVTSLITPTGKYLMGKGPYPCFSYPTIRDLLDARGVSWLYFTNTLDSAVWNAFEAINAVRNGPQWPTHIIRPQTRIYHAIANGTLPAVSWVIPDTLDSDHPGTHSDSGPSWVASVVNAVGESAYWPNTAIIVVWDDWGGEYDHVAPPQLDGQGLGMRVPMLLISAFARQSSTARPGYISHTQYEFGSILRFIEDMWSLGTLGTTDARAASLMDCFDFAHAPRRFTPFKTKYSKSFFEKRPPSNLPVDSD